MRVNFEFVLPKDEYEYKIMLHGNDYFNVLFDLYTELRNKVKYDINLTEAESKVYNEIYDKFIDMLNEKHIDLFE